MHEVSLVLPYDPLEDRRKDDVIINIFLFAFDEGRTLPNLLGCLLSRRFPVHANES